MNEVQKTDEILRETISIDKELSELMKRLSTMESLPAQDALECGAVITQVRAKISEMSKKILENYLPTDAKYNHLSANASLLNEAYKDAHYYSDLINIRETEKNRQIRENEDKQQSADIESLPGNILK